VEVTDYDNVTITLAYHGTKLITLEKSFILKHQIYL
jgi:hypothetical protein